jgi:hypothetical protein
MVGRISVSMQLAMLFLLDYILGGDWQRSGISKKLYRAQTPFEAGSGVDKQEEGEEGK